MSDQQGDVSPHEGEAHHGWSPDIGGSASDTAAEAGAKARQTPTHEPGAGTGGDTRAAAADDQALSDTDMEPGSPFGAGDSHTTRGEDTAAAKGAEPEGHKDPSQRPYGTSGTSD